MDETKLKIIPEPDRTSFRQLMSRCEKASIEYKLGPEQPSPDFHYLEIFLQSGREKRGLFVVDEKSANELALLKFEEHVFVRGYQAICCYTKGYIEAYIRLLRPTTRGRILSRLLDIPYAELKKRKPEDLVFKLENEADDGSQITITMSEPTNTILSLTMRELDEESGLTIKIAGLHISTNEQATAILEKLANSLFFEVRTIQDVPLMLEHYREVGVHPRWMPKSKGKKPYIGFPKYQYDADPLNLYWYATSAYQMPLLQFLAYYQVLEFYFPIYSTREVQTELANILKDPQFDPNHHLDINRVVSAVQSKIGKGYGNERDQLLATIKGCVQEKEIRELLERDDLKDYFNTSGKVVCTVKLSIDSRNSNLRDELADRLYDIRCGIVHTKAEETEKRRILPYSEEETLLRSEIQVIEFLARKAIIAMSKRLSI